MTEPLRPEPLRSSPLRIALAGVGTVGAGVIRLIEANAALIARRAGRPIRIVAISARDRGKQRGVDLATNDFFIGFQGAFLADDPAFLATWAARPRPEPAHLRRTDAMPL